MPDLPDTTTRLGSRVRGGLWALTGVAALSAAGWVWVSGRPERALAEATRLAEEGSPGEALLRLPPAESAPGTRERALLLRARVAVERRDLAGAVGALDGVRHDGPHAGEFAYWKGRTLYEAGQPLLALRWFEAARSARPDDPDAARWTACAAYDLGDRSTAVAALEAVARLAPRDARVWRTLGTIFQENVKYEQARDAFEHSLKLDRAQPDLCLELAETHLRLGEIDRAVARLKECQGHVPEERHADLLAEVLGLKGDLEGARGAVARGLAVSPGHAGLLSRDAAAAAFEGRLEDALTRLNQAASADPYRSQTFHQRASVLRRLGREADADRDAARAASLNRTLARMSALNDEAAEHPRDADLRYRVGEACSDLGMFDLAASWFRAARACDPAHDAARKRLTELRPPTAARRPMF